METLSFEGLFHSAAVSLDGDFPDIGLKYAIRAIGINPVLNEDQQNVFFALYRCLANRLRRSVSGLREMYGAVSENESHSRIVATLIGDVTNELISLCAGLSEVVTEQLLPKVEGADRAVYYLVMGDFARFVAELEVDESVEAMESSLANYNLARQAAESIPIEEPVHLDIILNTTKLMNDVLGQTEEAVQLAETAYNSALPRLSNLAEGKAATSRQILQVLKDNAIAWIT